MRSYFDFLHRGHDSRYGYGKQLSWQRALNATTSSFPCDPHPVSVNRRSFSIHSLSCDWQVLSPYSNSSELSLYPPTTVSSRSHTICCYVWRSSLEARNRARSQGPYNHPFPPHLAVSDASTVRLCRHSRIHRQWSRNAHEVGVVYQLSSAASHRASPLELGLRTDMASSSDN